MGDLTFLQSQLPVKITDGTNAVSLTGTALNVTGTFTPSGGTQTVTGTVTTVANGGSVTVSAGPATQTVSGTVTTVANGGTVTVVTPATQTVAGTVTTVANGGTVTVSAGAGTMTMTGTVTTGFQYATNATFTGTPTGAMIMAVRNDSPATLISTNLSYGPLSVDQYGRLQTVASGTTTITGGGTSTSDQATYTQGSSQFNMVGGWFYDSATAIPAQTEGIFRMTAYRGLHINLRNNSGVEIGTAANPVTIVPNGGTQTVVGTITTVGNGGTVTVAAGPAAQTVAGTVTTVANGGTITVSAGPAAQTVAGTVTTVANGGTVTVSAGPSTQTVTGTLVTTPGGEVSTGLIGSGGIYYGTSATVATSSTGTISYTVSSGKTLFLKGLFASSSGAPCKVVLDYTTGTTYTTLMTGFYSAAQPYLNVTFGQPISIASLTPVNIKITNNAGAAQDVYTALSGHEV